MIKINKVTILLIVMLITMALSVTSDVNYIDEGDAIGNPYHVKKSMLFTVVGNMECSTYPDNSGYVYAGGSAIGFNNKASYPKIYQVFSTYGDRLVQSKVGEITLLTGESGDIDIESGKEYFYQIFYCNVEQKECRETYPYYTAGCDYDTCEEGQVLRVRGIEEITPGGCDDWDDRVCVTDSHFNYDCTQSANKLSASAGDDGSDQTITDNGAMRGEWRSLGIPTNVDPGKHFTIRAKFVALEAGKYYLEAGMLPEAFALEASTSKCDGSVHFAGDFITLQKGESVDVVFTPKAYDEKGTYSVVLGAYTGCLNEGGSKITTISQIVNVGQVPGNSLLGAAIGISSFVSIGFVLVFVIAVLLILWWANK